jgi:hypothetical protein
MSMHEWLTTAELRELFAEEITAAGGTVSDTFDDGRRLFVRSVLPQVREVRAADRLQGGVALRACEGEVWVHPYVFRLVCRNGAIMAQAIQTRHIEAGDFATPEATAADVRAAIRACSAEEAFTTAAEQMRSALEAEVDIALNLLPTLSRLPSHVASQLVPQIVERFFGDGDRSRFGLMNAVTSLARDTRDPELRWRLEELGGAVPVERPPTPKPRGAAKAVLVG